MIEFSLYKEENSQDTFAIKVNSMLIVFSFDNNAHKVYHNKSYEETGTIIVLFTFPKSQMYTKIKDDCIPKPPRMKDSEFGNNTRKERKDTNHFLKAIRNHYPEHCL